MRNGWRTVVVGVGALLLGGLPGSLPRAGRADHPAGPADRPVRVTLEVGWASPADGTGGAGVELEVSEGRVIGAVAVPAEGVGPGPGPVPGPGPEQLSEGRWRLGPPGRGRVRVRVEAPVGAGLLLRAGDATTPMRFPLALVLEGPQRTPPQAAAEITVERVAWDALAVDLGGEADGGGSDGVVAPGARVPVAVGFRLLAPEPGEAAVRCTAELRPARGGEPVWSQEVRTSVPTHSPAGPPTVTLALDAPKEEGTYVLEVRAAWEPAAPAHPHHEGGKLLNRLIRRGKRGSAPAAPAGSASRKVTLAVLGPAAPAAGPAPAPAAAGKPKGDIEADAVDLARMRGSRPWGAGRSAAGPEGARAPWVVPEAALAAATPRERLRGLIGRAGAEVATLGPAGAGGLAWSSLGLKVAHPGRPHRLTVTVASGRPAALGVALVAPGGGKPRVLLDTCASGPAVPTDGPPVSFSWPVWPDAADPVLVLVNRATGAPVRVGSVTLTELAEPPAGPTVETPTGVPGRTLGLYLDAAGLDRFGGAALADGGPADPLAAARNLAAYAAGCGATAVVLPEGLADRARRRALDGTAFEDAVGPDRLALALRVLARKGVAAWVELDLTGPLPGLPDPASPEALARGLVRVDREGQADGTPPAYHPLADEVAAALRRRVADAARGHGAAGLLVRLGQGPTLLGGPDTGFDDATFARFVRESFDPETARTVPGVGAGTGAAGDDTGRFAARATFLAGPGRMPWQTWRSKRVAALYADLAAATREAAPGSALAVATPGPDDGPAGSEARRADLAGLAPSLAWRAVGLDLDAWPTGDAAPIVLRGVGLGPDELAHDLATSPELDAKVAARPARGFLLDLAGPPLPPLAAGRAPALRSVGLEDGPDGDEPLGHALAALDAGHVWLAAAAVAGREERLRRFARVFLALPATPPAESQRLPFGVAVRAHPAGERTYLALANDTPYPVRLDAALTGPAASLFDLGRGTALNPAPAQAQAQAPGGGRHLVLDLPPFGVAAVRAAGPGVKVGSVTPYPSQATLTALEARYRDVSAQLTRLNHGGDPAPARGGPPNPGFEAEAEAEVTATAETKPGPMPEPGAKEAAPRGWRAEGGAVARDTAGPHSGRAALRLDAPGLPASVVSDGFAPDARGALIVRAWLKSDRADAKVRLWIEGESAGAAYRRVSELAVPASWSERAVRAADVPPAGLESLRLRFEMLTPGRLWVDDLGVTGEPLSEPERRNARLALLAALQAYGDKRFADFARLAGSRWTRRLAPPADGAGPTPRVAADRGGASALPPGSRLR